MDINKKLNDLLDLQDTDNNVSNSSLKKSVENEIRQLQNKQDINKNFVEESNNTNRRNHNQIVTRIFEPINYDDARNIANALVGNQIVYVYLDKLSDLEANRIIDFLTGVVFGLAGDIERLDSELFICTPMNIDITDELRMNINNGGV